MLFGSTIVAMLYCALIFVMGALAASAFVLEKRPDAKDTLNKLAPYKGGIGIAALIWSFIRLLNLLFSGVFGAMLDHVPIRTLTYIVIVFCGIVGGFLLGYQIIAKNLLSSNEEATEKAQSLRKTLLQYEKAIGLAAMLASALFLILILLGIHI